MDPGTVYSLFCDIITLVDGAIKTAKSLNELYHSSSGLSKEAQRLQDQTEHLTAIANSLSSSQAQLRLMPQRPLLNKVVEECVEVSRMIQLILDKSKVDHSGPKAVAVLKAWTRSQTTKAELQELQLELQANSDRLRNVMALATK
jgi:hypothetical protein